MSAHELVDIRSVDRQFARSGVRGENELDSLRRRRWAFAAVHEKEDDQASNRAAAAAAGMVEN
jgi:hypothetical protein